MASPNYSFTTLTGSETAGYSSINALITSIDTQLNKRIPNKDTSGTGAYDGMVPVYSNAASSGFTQGFVDTANIAASAITEAKIASGAVTNAKIRTDAVTLGTQTTGSYVASISAGGSNEIATTGTGEGAAATVRLADNTALRGAATVATPPTYTAASTGTVGRIPDAKYVTDALSYATSGGVTLSGDVTGATNANSIANVAVTNTKILYNAVTNDKIAPLTLTLDRFDPSVGRYTPLSITTTGDITVDYLSSSTNGVVNVTGTSPSIYETRPGVSNRFMTINHASTPIVLSLPNTLGVTGDVITLCQTGAASVTIKPKVGATATINGSTSVTYTLGAQYSVVTLICLSNSGSNGTWVITGDYA